MQIASTQKRPVLTSAASISSGISTGLAGLSKISLLSLCRAEESPNSVDTNDESFVDLVFLAELISVENSVSLTEFTSVDDSIFPAEVTSVDDRAD